MDAFELFILLIELIFLYTIDALLIVLSLGCFLCKSNRLHYDY